MEKYRGGPLCRWLLTFFGLTPEYRVQLYNEIHDLVYHGGGGFSYSEVYNMPIHIRRYSISRINQHVAAQNEAQEKAVNEARNKR